MMLFMAPRPAVSRRITSVNPASFSTARSSASIWPARRRTLFTSFCRSSIGCAILPVYTPGGTCQYTQGGIYDVQRKTGIILKVFRTAAGHVQWQLINHEGIYEPAT